MSDPAPAPRPGARDPAGEAGEMGETDGTGRQHVVLRTLARLRPFLVLGPLVVALLVAAGVGASLLWADIPDKTIAGSQVTCWDGRIGAAADCTDPRGRRGVHWVFPSYDPKDERCAQVRTRARSRPYDIACELRLDQRPVTVTYAVRASVEKLTAAVRRSYGSRPVSEADGDRIVFRSGKPDGAGLYRVTVVYADHPFAVTVEAPDPRVRDTALDELVRFRAADEILVRQD